MLLLLLLLVHHNFLHHLPILFVFVFNYWVLIFIIQECKINGSLFLIHLLHAIPGQTRLEKFVSFRCFFFIFHILILFLFYLNDVLNHFVVDCLLPFSWRYRNFQFKKVRERGRISLIKLECHCLFLMYLRFDTLRCWWITLFHHIRLY